MPTPLATRREDDVEILVHIAAPARTADDRHYRSLADAYLSFQSGTRSCLVVSDSLPDSNTSVLDHGAPESSPTRSVSRHSSPGSSELSFSGAWGNPESPRLATTSKHHHSGGLLPSQASIRDSSLLEDHPESGPQTSTQQDSLVPPSEVPDSMPLTHCGMVGLVSPNRFIEHFLRAPQSSQTGAVPFPSLGDILPTSPIAKRRSEVVIPGTPSNRRALSVTTVQKATDAIPIAIPGTSNQGEAPPVVDAAPFVIPDTPPAEWQPSPLPSSSSDSDLGIIEDTVLEGGPSTKRAAPTTTRAESEPAQSKRPRLSSNDPTPGPLTRSISDSGANEDHQTPHPLVLQGTDTEYLSLTEIDAPEPPTGLGEILPASLITINLSTLANVLDISHRYRPVERVRELRPLERGYWLIDCSGWGEADVHKAWGFLHNYLSKGYAGWGTRCVRDEEWGWIRLWCFGHVVGHCYLLLYLASMRKLKTQGARWIDGEGRVVLVTDGHA